MDAIVKPLRAREARPPELEKTPSREEAEAAVRTLIRWAGDDPAREGLVDTPRRVAKAFEELFAGYRTKPSDILDRVVEEVAGYGDIVRVRDIPFASHCEHHMIPFTGCAHIAYYPAKGVVGLSKLAPLVDAFARRLQTQERRRGAPEPRPRRGCLPPPSPDPGEPDGADRRHHRRGAAAARRRRDARGRAPVHVDARRPQGRLVDGHDAVHRRVQGRPGRAGPVPDARARRLADFRTRRLANGQACG